MPFKSYEIRDRFISAVRQAIIDGKLGHGTAFCNGQPICSIGHGLLACDARELTVFAGVGLTLEEGLSVANSNDQLFPGSDHDQRTLYIKNSNDTWTKLDLPMTTEMHKSLLARFNMERETRTLNDQIWRQLRAQ